MAVHLMTTTGTETDVRAALGLTPETSQATTPPDGPISASVETLPTTQAPPEPPVEAAPVPETPAESDEDTTTDQTPQEKGAQTKGRLQKRIDELVAARYHTQGELDSARRQIAELQARLDGPAPAATPPTRTPLTPPKEADYETYEQYLDARADYRVEVRLAADKDADEAKRAQDESTRRRTTLHERIVTFAHDHPDYDEVVSNPALPSLTPWIIDRLTDPRNEIGPAMGYALAKDPARLAALVAMDAPDALEALGALKVELRSNGKPAVALPKLPSAPPPPTQVRGSAVVTPVTLDDLAKSITPGDPRTSDWLARRNEELAKRGKR
jgi:hypothetical protein